MAERPWVLVTADGPQLRDPLVAVRGLAAGGYRAGIALSCERSLAQVSRDCERIDRVPGARDPGFAAAVAELVRRRGYLAVLPASESALLGLDMGPEHLVDKAQLAEIGDRVGIPSPKTDLIDTYEEMLAAASTFDYPVILKPTVHRANAIRCDRPEDVRAARFEDPVMVQPFLTDPSGAVCGVMWKDRIVASVHERWFRTWPADCGVAASAVTVEPDLELESRLAELMQGYEGLFNAQFIGPNLIDLNLRVSTTHPLSVAAGANLVAIWCDVLRGQDVPVTRARAGVRFRWIEGDVRSLAVALRRRTIRPQDVLRALRPQTGSAHATESLRDPKPMLRRALYLGSRVLGGPP